MNLCREKAVKRVMIMYHLVKIRKLHAAEINIFVLTDHILKLISIFNDLKSTNYEKEEDFNNCSWLFCSFGISNSMQWDIP
jgi:hypothetical protein